VQEYTTRFIRMMRYAPKETSSNKKKMYHYKKGLNSHLKIALLGHECHTLQQMINKVLEMERDRLEDDAQRERKEKRRRGKGSSRTPAQRQRGYAPPQSRSRFAQGAASSRGGGSYSANRHRPTQGYPAQSSSQSTWKAPTSTATGSVPFACFTCGQPGHKSAVCPQRAAPVQTPARQAPA
jgi:hypothetical protein